MDSGEAVWLIPVFTRYRQCGDAIEVDELRIEHRAQKAESARVLLQLLDDVRPSQMWIQKIDRLNGRV